jgi:hypothetical protein
VLRSRRSTEPVPVAAIAANSAGTVPVGATTGSLDQS